jgi:hypothetical protein
MKANKENCGLCKFFKDDDCTMMRSTDKFGHCRLFRNRGIERTLTGEG